MSAFQNTHKGDYQMCYQEGVDLLENALYAVPSVEGYAIRCVLCNTIIIPNVWASRNINMSHMYIDQIQLHVIYFNQHLYPPPPQGYPCIYGDMVD